MNYWSNIETPPQDSEIIDINTFEQSLGKFTENVQKIRELIRRFELCHFKYRVHLEYIKQSIQTLRPNIEPAMIGVNHISKGRDVINIDKTGRSRAGQQYLDSLRSWLCDSLQQEPEYFNAELNQQVTKWLGDKNQEKERIVRLLVARLTWDWESYEQYQHGREYKELELQACRMDICHYAFPGHLDLLLQGIGRMESIDKFEGCGSYNPEIKTYVDQQFSILCDHLRSSINKNEPGGNEQIKIWLTACLAKTLKAQAGLEKPMPLLPNY